MRYYELLSRIAKFEYFCGASTGSLGESALGRMIPYVEIGRGQPKVLCLYATHAREYVTTDLAIMHISHYIGKLREAEKGRAFGTYCFIPMHNPDGAELCQAGLETVGDQSKRAFLYSANSESTDFSLFKANADAVDLNVNFPAGFGKGVNNLKAPSPENYTGKYPLSEPENKALARFMVKSRFSAALTFHTKGRQIYWRFFQDSARLKRDGELAEKLSMASGYALVDGYGSYGGFKDWCIQTLGIPAFTVECGDDSLAHPLGVSSLDEINGETKELPRIVSEYITNEVLSKNEGIFSR